MTEKNMQTMTEQAQGSRRDFIKQAAYVAPAILTLAVAPSYAKAGSNKEYDYATAGSNQEYGRDDGGAYGGDVYAGASKKKGPQYVSKRWRKLRAK